MNLLHFKNLNQFKYRLRLYFMVLPVLMVTFIILAKYGSSIGDYRLIHSEQISYSIVHTIYIELKNQNVVNLGNEEEFTKKFDKKGNREIIWHAVESFNISLWYYTNSNWEPKYIVDYEEFEKALFSKLIWVKQFDARLLIILLIISIIVFLFFEFLMYLYDQFVNGRLSETLVGLYLKKSFLKSCIRKNEIKKEINILEKKLKQDNSIKD